MYVLYACVIMYTCVCVHVCILYVCTCALHLCSHAFMCTIHVLMWSAALTGADLWGAWPASQTCGLRVPTAKLVSCVLGVLYGEGAA